MGHRFHAMVYRSAKSTVALKCIVAITDNFVHFINLCIFGGIKLLCLL